MLAHLVSVDDDCLARIQFNEGRVSDGLVGEAAVLGDEDCLFGCLECGIWVAWVGDCFVEKAQEITGVIEQEFDLSLRAGVAALGIVPQCGIESFLQRNSMSLGEEAIQEECPQGADQGLIRGVVSDKTEHPEFLNFSKMDPQSQDIGLEKPISLDILGVEQFHILVEELIRIGRGHQIGHHFETKFKDRLSLDSTSAEHLCIVSKRVACKFDDLALGVDSSLSVDLVFED